MRLIVRWAMGLVALAAAALSFQSLWRLGELAEYRSLAWAYPLVVDLGAAASCAAWLHTRSRQAAGMTWVLLLISVLLNGTVHYLEATRTAPSWLLIVAVSAVPPAVLGLCVHLAVGLGASAAAADPHPGATRTSPAKGTEDPRTPEGVQDLDTPDVATTDVSPIPDGMGRVRLARHLNVSEHHAKRLLKASRADGTG